MKFFAQTLGSSDPADRQHASEVANHLKTADYESPNALMQALLDHASKHALGWRVSDHAGVINLHGPRGILLRIRSIA